MHKIYTNCFVVTRDQLFTGTVVVENGLIKDVDESLYQGNEGIDLKGDFLLPGLIEMHTDNLEKNLQPRPGVIWPSTLSAAIAHDAQIAGAGITTVYDAVAVGGLRESSLRTKLFRDSVETLCRGNDLDVFRVDHFLHLRCEVSNSLMEETLEEQIDRPQVRLLSIMDHTPGQRQWTDLAKWREYHRDKRWTEEEADAILKERLEMQEQFAHKHRKIAIDAAKIKGIPLASHDDTSEEDVRFAAEQGINISEFPTTMLAAQKARENNITTIMGAPNAVRGVSHSGNISAASLAREGLLDGLSSDYAPNSLLHAAFHLANTLDIALPKTVSMVSSVVADMVGLKDRGEIKEGKLADLIQVKMVDDLPVIRKVWKRGEVVA